MSARGWLYSRLTGALLDPELVSAELDAFRAEVLREAAAEIDRLRSELEAERRLLVTAIGERDTAQDMADKLAYAVADERVIGEHSDGNCPWVNALDLITPAAEVDRLRMVAARQSVLLQRAHDEARTALAHTGGA